MKLLLWFAVKKCQVTLQSVEAVPNVLEGAFGWRCVSRMPVTAA